MNKAKNNTRLLWKTINDIAQRNQTKSAADELIANCADPNDAVNRINDYFVNVGENLANKITKTQIMPPIDATDRESFPNSLVFLPTDEAEVERLLLSLRSNSVGWDSISAKILRSYRHVIVPPLTYICNLAIQTGFFPQAFKKALIIPIHKSGPKDRVDNYRPISILPSMSKVLEKIMNTRLIKFLESNKLLSPSQFGFRSGLSTANAVHELTDHIFNSLDKKNKCLTIFLDLAKAFDTVSVPLLLQKLERVGVRGLQHNLFSSYLSNRTQCVKVGSLVSDDLPVAIGVPQGSVLAPTLFLVYVNELCKLQLPNGLITAFADDTALTFSANSWEEVFRHAQYGFDTVINWLCAHRLTLNIQKTKYILFTKRGLPPSLPLSIVTHSSCPLLPGSSYDCPILESVLTIK